MAILIILGLFGALYMLWLIFSLAAYALPFSAGLAVFFWMHGHGSGILAAIAIAFLCGVALLVAGQLLFANIRSPLARLAIAAIFAIPAGIAGYHAAYGIGRLAIDPGAALTILCWISALVIGWSAVARLTGGQVIRDEPASR